MKIKRFLFFEVVLLILVSGCMVPVDYDPTISVNINEDLGIELNESSGEEIVDVNITEETGVVNETNVSIGVGESNETNFTEEIEINYGDAVFQDNNTYMFKINYQVNVGGKMIRVEKIYPDFVLVFVDDLHEKIKLDETERIEGMNITSTEIFYDNIASGRMAYLRIV